MDASLAVGNHGPEGTEARPKTGRQEQSRRDERLTRSESGPGEGRSRLQHSHEEANEGTEILAQT